MYAYNLNFIFRAYPILRKFPPKGNLNNINKTAICGNDMNYSAVLCCYEVGTLFCSFKPNFINNFIKKLGQIKQAIP